jgi:MoaA/NifB/PqqE/SkfB family radical SAM enzyme
MKLDLLYRGPLESCNYGCDYCPFAKREDPPEALLRDEEALDRFLAWIRTRTSDRIGVLFTPWGEALVRGWYRDALIELTRLTHVRRASIQTNLSTALDWVDRCVPERLGIWATYHPEWTERARFVRRVTELFERGVSVSAGVVGFSKFEEEIAALRRELPSEVYLWINAPKRFRSFTDREIASLEAVDPLFGFNATRHASLGERCFTGSDTISVDGDGDVRRCHFIEDVLGNLYRDDLSTILRDRPCPASTCGCHIGYVHLSRLGLRQIFGDGILERVPAVRPDSSTSTSTSTSTSSSTEAS